MSGIEVVAAVAAVISAFHGGSELLKHIKAKRRKTRQALKEFEERQLQDSLVTGEQQIGLRYAQDMREFGDLMRVGDVIARDRLQHITIMMQGEVIKSLQMAAQYDKAILNLTLLHEASITNRRDAIVTLDELKQRLLTRRPILRQIEAVPEPFSSRGSIGAGATNYNSNTSPAVPDNYVPAAVTLPTEESPKETKHTLSSYFRTKRNNSASNASDSSSKIDINFSPAFEQLARARGSEDRAIIMKDIDHIIDSYQGLHINHHPSELWGNKPWDRKMERKDTLTMLNEGTSYPNNSSSQTKGAKETQRSLSPTFEQFGPGDYPTYLAFDQSAYSPQQEQQGWSQPYTARNPFPQLQTQDLGSRLSAASASSSAFSDAPSLNRNSSTSSQESQPQSSPRPLNFPVRNNCNGDKYTLSATDSRYSQQEQNLSPSAPHVPSSGMYSQPIAPLSAQRPREPSNAPLSSSPRIPYSPDTAFPYGQESPVLGYWAYAAPQSQRQSHSIAPIPAASQQSVSVQEQRTAEEALNRPRYTLLPPVARETSSSKSIKSERTVTQSLVSATTLGTAPAAAGLRHASAAPSIASTDSSGSATMNISPAARSKMIRASTIQSGPAGAEKMMDGRPCKTNNYWGFCKGSWTIREDVKKGLALRIQPSGMYNTREIWECTECTFKGATFPAPHPTKKNKTVTIVDPRIVSSQSGIRYKWIFLAKCHVKKTRQDSHTNESNYGCILCSVEDKVSSVYGGVETLMNHIALCHVADTSEKTQRKVGCIVGRVADGSEEWDLNIPASVGTTELDASTSQS